MKKEIWLLCLPLLLLGGCGTYEDGVTWIKVYGILREATVHLNDHLTAPFYHLEAVKVEKMDQPGIGTITD